VGQQRRPEEFLEGIGKAVEELESKQRLEVGRGGQKKEEIGMGEAEDEGWGVGVGEVDEARSRGRVGEVKGQEVCRRQWS